MLRGIFHMQLALPAGFVSRFDAAEEFQRKIFEFALFVDAALIARGAFGRHILAAGHALDLVPPNDRLGVAGGLHGIEIIRHRQPGQHGNNNHANHQFYE